MQNAQELPVFLETLIEIRASIDANRGGKWWDDAASLLKGLGEAYERIWRPDGIESPEVPPVSVQRFSTIQPGKPKPAWVGERYPQKAKLAWLLYYQRPEGLPRVRHKTLEIDGHVFDDRADEVIRCLGAWIRFVEKLLPSTPPRTTATVAAPSQAIYPIEPTFRFAKSGGVYKIEAFGEKGNFPASLKGFRQLESLIKSPNKAILIQSLYSIDSEASAPRRVGDCEFESSGESLHKVIDQKTVESVAASMQELMTEKATADANNDEGRSIGLFEEIERLREYLEDGTGLGDEPRRFPGESESVRRAVEKTLQTARKKLLECGLPTLATHLKECIDREGLTVKYTPGDSKPDWRF